MEYFQINLAYDLHEDGIRGLTAFIHELYCHDLIPQKFSYGSLNPRPEGFFDWTCFLNTD